MVKVAGLSKAFKMDLDDVLVKAEDMYHITQRPYKTTCCQQRPLKVFR